MFCNKNITNGGCACATISGDADGRAIKRALLFFAPPLLLLAVCAASGSAALSKLPAVAGLTAAVVGAMTPLIGGAKKTENKRC
jgi:hypothetical protein